MKVQCHLVFLIFSFFSAQAFAGLKVETVIKKKDLNIKCDGSAFTSAKECFDAVQPLVESLECGITKPSESDCFRFPPVQRGPASVGQPKEFYWSCTFSADRCISTREGEQCPEGAEQKSFPGDDYIAPGVETNPMGYCKSIGSGFIKRGGQIRGNGTHGGNMSY